MKVIVAGGRDFSPQIRHAQWLKKQLAELKATEIVSGGASGADKFGENIAKEIGLPVKVFAPNWNLFGKRAGPIRNADMAEYAEACVTFPGGRGTASMETLAKQSGMPVIRWLDRK